MDMVLDKDEQCVRLLAFHRLRNSGKWWFGCIPTLRFCVVQPCRFFPSEKTILWLEYVFFGMFNDFKLSSFAFNLRNHYQNRIKANGLCLAMPSWWEKRVHVCDSWHFILCNWSTNSANVTAPDLSSSRMENTTESEIGDVLYGLWGIYFLIFLKFQWIQLEMGILVHPQSRLVYGAAVPCSSLRKTTLLRNSINYMYL